MRPASASRPWSSPAVGSSRGAAWRGRSDAATTSISRFSPLERLQHAPIEHARTGESRAFRAARARPRAHPRGATPRLTAANTSSSRPALRRSAARGTGDEQRAAVCLGRRQSTATWTARLEPGESVQQHALAGRRSGPKARSRPPGEARISNGASYRTGGPSAAARSATRMRARSRSRLVVPRCRLPAAGIRCSSSAAGPIQIRRSARIRFGSHPESPRAIASPRATSARTASSTRAERPAVEVAPGSSAIRSRGSETSAASAQHELLPARRERAGIVREILLEAELRQPSAPRRTRAAPRITPRFAP